MSVRSDAIHQQRVRAGITRRPTNHPRKKARQMAALRQRQADLAKLEGGHVTGLKDDEIKTKVKYAKRDIDALKTKLGVE